VIIRHWEVVFRRGPRQIRSTHDVLALEAALQSDFLTLEARHGQELDEIIMRARKDMQKHGYEPYFALEKRPYPDPAN
jgi:hypothetical protein